MLSIRSTQILVVVLSLLVNGCGRNRNDPIPTPQNPSSLAKAEQNQPTAAGIESATNHTHEQLIDLNLLEKPGIISACDGSKNAQWTCGGSMRAPHLEVAVSASDFVRWSLQWDRGSGEALTGSETLHLRLRVTGNLLPHLYLIDDSDRRVPIALPVERSSESWQDLYLPLAEAKDSSGTPLRYASISEVQLVFEWAAMQGSLDIEAVKFSSQWIEEASLGAEIDHLAASLTVPPGFRIQPIASGLNTMTQLQFIGSGEMMVSLQNGRVWRYTDGNGDGIFDRRQLYIAGLAEIVGLLHDPLDGGVWLGGRGQLFKSFDESGNGAADRLDLRIDGLPWGRHQNNGLTWNPDPDPFTGEAGLRWLYFGLGSTEDLATGGELNATVLRFPRSGQGQRDLEIVSRGNRNAYMVVWGEVGTAGNWQLFASENGPDFNDAPDEVNHIRWRHHYGFPERFGAHFDEPALEIEGLPYSGALYAVTAHASASGLAFVTNTAWPEEYRTLYVSLFGQVFDEAIVGHVVERINLIPNATETGPSYRAEASTFIDGLDRPLPMTTDLPGNLIVGDYATGVVYRVLFEPVN